MVSTEVDYLKRIGLLLLATPLLCISGASTINWVTGQANAPQIPSDWHKLSAGYFSIYAPPEWKFHKLQGIDSYVGEFVGDGIRLEFDYGQYSNSLPPDAKEPTYAVTQEPVGGHPAKIVSPRTPGHGLTAIYFPDVGDTNGLFFYGHDLTAQQQELTLRIFQTIRFK
jgi:hypothetical protein